MPVTVTFGNCPKCKEFFPHCICPKKFFTRALIDQLMWVCPACENTVFITDNAKEGMTRSGNWCEHQQQTYGFTNK